MGDPYTSVSVSGYNSNPPPDDGTTVATNRITWSGIKSKLGDPLNTAVAAINTNIDAAFAKTISGGSVVSTAVDYPMTSTDQGRLIRATASPVTITTPDATVVTAPFMFAVKNESSGNITLDGNGSQTIDGLASITLRPGSGILVFCDGSNWHTSGTVPAGIATVNPAYGFDSAINMTVVASVGSSILTVALKANDGTDPTASNPILIPFRDSTIGNGGPIWRAVTAAISINTNAVGATLGTTNGVPFRFWLVAFDDGGTVRLALINCTTATQIFPLEEDNVASATGISAAATSAGVFYCPNGVTITSKSFRILAFLNYASGLATAGTYSSAPNRIALFGPGIKKPGDILQSAVTVNATSMTTSNTTRTATALAQAITPSSSVNLILVRATGTCTTSTAGSGVPIPAAQIVRTGPATANIGNISAAAQSAGAGVIGSVVNMIGLDAPGSIAVCTYTVNVWNSAAGQTLTWLQSSGTVAESGAIEVHELMG